MNQATTTTQPIFHWDPQGLTAPTLPVRPCQADPIPASYFKSPGWKQKQRRKWLRRAA